ncbi:hypothetical protein [Algivirga pacifica]|uniref:Uncharacterized protein n=1 Tax=Algivirga pacifica TaxID=1162670 RepID=A0ABP9D572_9BACT
MMILLLACDGTFVPDPIDPRLPKYSESGNETAGAMVNGKVWGSTVTRFLWIESFEPIVVADPLRDSLFIEFIGYIEEEQTTIRFHLSEQGITKFDDLENLKGQKITLDGQDNTALIGTRYYSRNATPRGVGQIFFRFTDLDSTRLILSGTFGFTTTNASGSTTEVSHGRFDYRINKDRQFYLDTSYVNTPDWNPVRIDI